MSDVVNTTKHGAVAVVSINNPPVNALSLAVRQGLQDAVLAADADESVAAIVILGEGRAFIAGADIKEFGKPPMEPHLPDVCARIEAISKPLIASMHGVSLGGGLEVAVSTHYRVAAPSARVGLPEVHLGLIPGAGGTQRVPRLTSAEAAIEIITSGRHVGAAEAARLGLIDRVVDGTPLENGLAYAEELIAQGAGPRRSSALGHPDPLNWDATYDAVLAKGRGQISPAYAVRAIQASVEKPFDEGIAEERRIFWELMNTDQRKGMIHAFFSERAVGNLPELKGVAPRELAAIGVIGGGTMGAGIATAVLLSGLSVVMLEMSAEAAEAAKERIVGNLQGALKRGKIDPVSYTHLTLPTICSV